MQSPILTMGLDLAMIDRIVGLIMLLCIPFYQVYLFLRDQRHEEYRNTVDGAVAAIDNNIRQIRQSHDKSSTEVEKLKADNKALEARLVSQEARLVSQKASVAKLEVGNALRKTQIKNCDNASLLRSTQLWDTLHTEIEKSRADYISQADFDARIKSVTKRQVAEMVSAKISQGDVPRITELERQLALVNECLRDTIVPALKNTAISNALEQLVAKVDNQATTYTLILEKTAATDALLKEVKAKVDNHATISSSALEKAAAGIALVEQLSADFNNPAASSRPAIKMAAANDALIKQVMTKVDANFVKTEQLTVKVDKQATTFGPALKNAARVLEQLTVKADKLTAEHDSELKETAANSALLGDLAVKVDGLAADIGLALEQAASNNDILGQLVAKTNEHAATKAPVQSPDYTSPAFSSYRTPLSLTPEEDYPKSVVMLHTSVLQQPLSNLSLEGIEGIPIPSPPIAHRPGQENLLVEASQGPDVKGNAEVVGVLTAEETREVKEVTEEKKVEISAANTEAAVEKVKGVVEEKKDDPTEPETSEPKPVMAEVTEVTPAKEVAAAPLVQALDTPAASNTPSLPEAIPTPPTLSGSPCEPWTQSDLATDLARCSVPTHAVEESVAIPVADPSPCHEIQMTNGENSLVEDAATSVAAATARNSGAVYQPASLYAEMGVTDDGTNNVEIGGMGNHSDDTEMGGTDDEPIGAEETDCGDTLMSDDNDGGWATISSTNLFNVPAFHIAAAAVPATPASNADGMQYELTKDGTSDEGAGVDSIMEDVSASESRSFPSVMNPNQYSQPPLPLQLPPLPFSSGFPSLPLPTQRSNAPPVFGSIYTNLSMDGNIVAAIPQSSQGGWMQQHQQPAPQQPQPIPQQQQPPAPRQQQQPNPQQQQQQQPAPLLLQQPIDMAEKKRKQIESVKSATLKKQKTQTVGSTTVGMSQVDVNAPLDSNADSIQSEASAADQGFSFVNPGIPYPGLTAQDDSIADGKGKASALILKIPSVFTASTNPVSSFQSGSQSSSSPILAAQNSTVAKGKGKAAASVFDNLPIKELPSAFTASTNLISPFSSGSEGSSPSTSPSQNNAAAKGKGKAVFAPSLQSNSIGSSVTAPKPTQSPSNNPPKQGPGDSNSASVPQVTIPRAMVPRATAPRATVPRATVPQVTVPQAVVPRATAPRAMAPRATAPRATVPRATVPRATESGTTGFLSSLLGQVERGPDRPIRNPPPKVASASPPQPSNVAGGSSSSFPKPVPDPKKLLTNVMVIKQFSDQDKNVISRLIVSTSRGPLRDRIVEAFWGASANIYRDRDYISMNDVKNTLEISWEEPKLNRVRTVILEYISEHGDDPQIQKWGAGNLQLLKDMERKNMS